MAERWLDFRSDTVTRPTPAMRAAMADASVGDDVFGEDPTVNQLQEQLAEMLGKEAALFAPSGTMSNQLGVKVHCRPGDELICEAGCHIYNYEQAGYVQLSLAAARTVEGQRGVLRLEQLTGLVRGEDDHLPRTRLVCLENTHNRGGGKIQPHDEVEAICRWAHGKSLATHLDGARLFNAVVASGISARDWSRHFDTVSVCFSKGLGAPVGSALAGPRELIRQARRHRKLLGGGMRQAGILAAAALYALENHVDRLADDHALAQQLAQGIAQIDGLLLDPATVETNIVIFTVAPHLGTAADFSARLKEQGLMMLDVGPQLIRAVTHLDVDDSDVSAALDVLAAAAQRASQEATTPAQGPRSAYA